MFSWKLDINKNINNKLVEVCFEVMFWEEEIDVEINCLVWWLNLICDKMKKENVFKGEDFWKLWVLSDLVFLVEG